MNYAPSINEWSARFAHHGLEEIDTVRSFRLRVGTKHCMSCLITFSPEGIAITGDITPTQNGTCSCRGYGIEWFAGELGWSYLAEKFLHKRFLPDVAAAEIRGEDPYWLGELADGTPDPVKTRAHLLAIAADLQNDGMGPERFCDAMWAAGDDCGFEYDPIEGLPGYGYCPNEVGILCAIQRRFAHTYMVMQVAEAEARQQGGGA